MSSPSGRGSGERGSPPRSSDLVVEAVAPRDDFAQASGTPPSDTVTGIGANHLSLRGNAAEATSEVQPVTLEVKHEGHHCACFQNLVEEITRNIVKELKSNDAGHWASLAEQTRTFDEARIDRWNKQIDSLLVYAALFSAIIAAFNIEFYKTLLQGPPTNNTPDATAALVAQTERTNALLYAIATGNASDIPAPIAPVATSNNLISVSSRKATRLAVAYNALWFSSLILSLIAASLATLVKQWLLRYLEPDFDSSPREHLRLRQHRYNGLRNRWGAPFVIGLLPMMLRISFILFLSGLVLELYILNLHLMIIVAVFGGIWALLYSFTSIIPAIMPDCPYKSPESLLVYNVFMVLSYFVLRPLGILESKFEENRYKWRDWRDQELDAMARENRTSELEVQALVAASVDLAISDQSLADVIEKCTHDLEPSMAIKLVHQIAHRRMYRSTPPIHKLEWKLLWDFSDDYADPEKKKRYGKITKQGTRALLNIAIHTATHSSEADFDTIIQAVSCIATLLNYAPKDPTTGFLGRLNKVIHKSLKSIQAIKPKRSSETKEKNAFLGGLAGGVRTRWAFVTRRGADEGTQEIVTPEQEHEATQSNAFYAVFTILHSKPDLCDSPENDASDDSSLSLKGILNWILASTTTGSSDSNESKTRDRLIYDQVFRYKRYEAGTVCYIVLRLAARALAEELDEELIKQLKNFLSVWTKMLGNATELALSVNSKYAEKCTVALHVMKESMPVSIRTELDSLSNTLKGFK